MHINPSPVRRLLLDSTLILALTVILAAVVFAFAYPWVPSANANNSALARYAPIHDGGAERLVESDASGKPTRWRSINTGILLNARALGNNLRQASRKAIEKFYREPGETGLNDDEFLARLAQTQIVETRSRELDAAGRASDTMYISLREPRGEFLVGFYFAENNSDVVFDPPVLLLPFDLGPNSKWKTEGNVGVNRYVWSGAVLQANKFASALGTFADCLQVETRYAIIAGDQKSESAWREWFCAGLGSVESEVVDANGATISRSVVLATDELVSPQVPSLPAVKSSNTAEQASSSSADFANWNLQRLGRMGRGISATESVVSPLWIPGDPPILLAAGYDSDLVAYNASSPTLTVLWSFHPGGTIFGQPAFDPTRHRIYFGASDKQLYALDARGLFLWAFNAEDNVASRPLVANDTIIFGSEDRNIYGVDAETGKERWRLETDAPVVSSAALAGNTAIIGSDDGTVYGIEFATGDIRWQFETGDAIEAPITVADSIAYVASRDGKLYALDAESGESVWESDGGSPLRTAPVVASGRAFVVSESSRLVAFDQKTGKRLWRTAEEKYAGPPIVLGETLIVAGNDGNIYRLNLDGVKQAEWSLTQASNVGNESAYFALGPTLGGDTIWLADRRAGLWRLGPENKFQGPTPLRLAWSDTIASTPFKLYPITTSPAQYGDQAIVLDSVFNIFQVDPANGKSTRLGQVSADTGALRLDPVVSGDTLLTIIGDTLFATQLPDVSPSKMAQPLWRFQGDGTGLRPVSVAENIVLWLTVPKDAEPGTGTGTLVALDLATGAVKWKHKLTGFGFGGGAVVRNGIVYVSTPPTALDLATGQVRWQARVDALTLGAPALDATGDTLFVGTIEGESGALAAIATADGSVRWRVRLSTEPVSPLESVRLSEGTIVYPTFKGKVVGLDATTGAERWVYSPPAQQLGTVTVDQGRVWLVLENSRVLALDAKTGKLAAQFSDLELNLNGVGLAQRPLVMGNRVVVPIGAALLGLK